MTPDTLTAAQASHGVACARVDQRERVWRRYTFRLAWFALATLTAALPLWRASATVDGGDAFYLAMSIQSVVWGAANAIFAARGLIDLRAARAFRGVRRVEFVAAHTTKIIRLLRLSRSLNRVWLAIAFALLVAGYVWWSPSLCGHGFGMLIQAVGLTLLDAAFLRALHDADSLAQHDASTEVRQPGEL